MLLTPDDVAGFSGPYRSELFSSGAGVADVILGFHQRPECASVLDALRTHKASADLGTTATNYLKENARPYATIIRNAVEARSSEEGAAAEVRFLRELVSTEAYRDCAAAELVALTGARRAQFNHVSSYGPAPDSGFAEGELIETETENGTLMDREDYYIWTSGHLVVYLSILTRSERAQSLAQEAVDALDRRVRGAGR